MKALTIILLSLLIQLTGIAQTVEIKSYVDKNKVSLNEVITFSINTNSNCQIYTPDFGGLTIIQGPFRSSSQSYSNINGKRSIQNQTTYTYRLRASKEGKFTIKPVLMKCEDKEYKTKSISIVAQANSTSSSSQTPTNINTTSDFFIRMYANQTEVYEGEPFSVTIKVFSKNKPENIENLEIGDSKGLLRKDLNPDQSSLNFDLEIINGLRYLTTVIRSELVFAQKPGNIKIEPAYISAIFSRGFFSQYRREATSNSLTIKVKPLPSNAPADFNGLVGDFSLSHKINKTKANAGEAIDFKVKISGSGNLNTFDQPNIAFPRSFEQFDPEVKEQLSYKSTGISGSISFNYVVIPTYHGKFSIPPYSFSYFDLESKTYKQVSTDSILLDIMQTSTSTAAGSDFKNSQKEIEIEETDIRHIMPYKNNKFVSSQFLVSNTVFYLLLLALPGAVWLLLWWKKRQKTDDYLSNSRTKTYFKKVKSDIETARSNAAINNNDEAVKVLSSALKTYIKQKNNISTLELSLLHVTKLYKDQDWSENDIDQLKAIWEEIDMYQYAPISANKLDALIDKVDALIDKIAAKK